jgi:hypothetical protein
MTPALQLIHSLKRYQTDYNGVIFSIQFDSEQSCIDTKASLSSLDVPFDEVSKMAIDLTVDDLFSPAKTFFSKEDFLKKFKGSSELDKVIIILFCGDTYLVYDNGLPTTGNGTINYIVTNTVSFLLFQEIILSIADYTNSIVREMVFHTSTKGIFKLKYPAYPVSLDDTKNITPAVQILSSKISDKTFQLFFKNEIADFVKKDIGNSFTDLLIGVQGVVEESDKNVELYLKNFSWETFRSKLYAEKDKYFIALRDILGKIMTQLVAVPISISATIFATYKIESIYVLVLVMLAFSFYVGFAFYIQTLYYRDTKEIASDFERDFSVIAEKSGLPPGIINTEKDKIRARISSIKRLIYLFSFIVIVLGSLFDFYLAGQVFKLLIVRLVIGLLLFIYYLILGYYTVKGR